MSYLPSNSWRVVPHALRDRTITRSETNLTTLCCVKSSHETSTGSWPTLSLPYHVPEHTYIPPQFRGWPGSPGATRLWAQGILALAVHLSFFVGITGGITSKINTRHFLLCLWTSQNTPKLHIRKIAAHFLTSMVPHRFGCDTDLHNIIRKHGHQLLFLFLSFSFPCLAAFQHAERLLYWDTLAFWRTWSIIRALFTS